MGQTTGRKITIGKSKLWYTNNSNQIINVLSELIKDIPTYFNINRPGQVKDLRNVSWLEKENIRRDFNKKATNNYFYSTACLYYSTAMGNIKVGYISSSLRGKIVLSKY